MAKCQTLTCLFFLLAASLLPAGICAHAATPQSLTGALTEQVMDGLYTGSGLYTKLNSQVGVQGIDGLFVRKGWSGRLEVLVVESKFAGSALSQDAAKGPQMSRLWIEKSLDQRIDSLKKASLLNPDVGEFVRTNREIALLENAKKAVNRGAYKRRIFHGTILRGQLVITLSGVVEVPVNGKAKTLPVRPADGPTKKGGSQFWQDTRRGRQLKIPLSGSAFDMMKAQVSPAEAGFLAAQRKQFLEALDQSLQSHGVAPRKAQRLVDGIVGGSIRNSRDLNRATGLALGAPRQYPPATSIKGRAVPRVSGLPPVRPFPGSADIAKPLPVRAALVHRGRRPNSQMARPFPATGRTPDNMAHYKAARKIIVPINVLDDALKLMETYIIIDMLYSGRMSPESFFGHSGQNLGKIGGKFAGGWIGAKSGAWAGAVLGPWGMVSGMIAGSIIGAFYCSDRFGDAAEKIALNLYGDIKKEEREKHQLLFVEALKDRYKPGNEALIQAGQ